MKLKSLALALLATLPLHAVPFVSVGSNGEKVNPSPFITALGGTTAGKSLFQIANPSAITFPRLNADNTATLLSAADFRTAIGAASLSGGNTLSGAQTYSGTLATTNTTDSTSTATGAITTAGGLGVEKDVFVGGNINFATSGKGIKGTATNNSAAAGVVGEFQANTVFLSGAIALTSGVALDITSITLTAGDWDVDGAVSINFSSATVSDLRGIAGTVSGTFDNTGLTAYGTSKPAGTGGSETLTLPRRRISASTTTTVYLIGRSTFSEGSAAAFGHIYARRIR